MTLWHGNSLSHASGAWMVGVGGEWPGYGRADRATLDTLDSSRPITLCFLSSLQGRQGIQGKNGNFGIAQPDGSAHAKKSLQKYPVYPGYPEVIVIADINRTFRRSRPG